MEEIKLFEELIRLKKTGQGGVLVTVVESEGSTPRKAGAKMLIRDNGTTFGTVGGGAVEQLAMKEAVQVSAAGQPRTITMKLTEEHGLTCGGSVRLYLEPLAQVPHLLVVGKGHIAQALQEIGPRIGFTLTLLEPPGEEAADFSLQEELERRTRNHPVSVIIACPSHQQDFIAARAAIEGRASFIGVIGSRRKRLSMENYLTAQGCTEVAIAGIVSPVGLPIGAETPAEIALSILAQIVKNRRMNEP